MICPNCQTDNPDQAKFCMNCGAALAAGPAPSAAGFDLDRYLPRELATRLKAARAHGGMAGERRVITILFCDIKGSTAAAERLDPEEWTGIVNGAFERMIRPVYRYEGFVPRLMGDAILAFFGAPIAHEDDPQRAVLAALEIQAGMEPYSRQVLASHGVDFKVRVGINTGLVVVGEIGSDLRLEYTAIGDAINLAARMEQTAEPGTIQISEETYKLVKPLFEWQALGETPIKGKSAPVRTYRVLAASGSPGQVRGVEGLVSPLVGREREVELMRARLLALEQGQGACVAVVGEAGLGKTSLLAEVRKREQGRARINWLEGHALSYARSVSYFAWRQIIRQAVGAGEDDAASVVRGKLNYTCTCCSLPGGDTAFLEAVLAVESEQSLQEISGRQGEALVQRMTESVRGFLCALAHESPLVIVLDDLHWMDSASLELFSRLADLVPEHPILFIGLSRPDQEAVDARFLENLRGRSHGSFDQMVLSPLSPEKTGTLLANLLGLQELPRKLVDVILQKTEGNPFFIEEIIRSLIETGQLVRDADHWKLTGDLAQVSLPATLTGLLGARIDHLPEEAKHVLQMASVIGRSFERATLAALGASALDASLRTLEEAALIQPEAGTGHAFRHVLVQDAAYDSILLKQRREWHRRVGTFFEETHGDRGEEFASALAHHFYAAGEPRSLRYDVQAAEAAERLYANAEAAVHYARALETARRTQAAAAQVADLYSRWGNALEQCGRYEQALKVYEDLRAFARLQENPAMEIPALIALSKIYSTFTSVHNPARADETLQRAVDLAHQLGDRDTEARLHWNLMLNYLFSNRLDQSLEHANMALKLARESGHRENLAYVLNDLCRLHTCRGEFDRSHAVIREARELWRALDNQVMIADSLGSEGEAYFNACEYEAALEILFQALEISERIRNPWGQCYDRMLIAFAYFENGQLGKAIPMANESVRLGDEAGLIASNSLRTELAWVYAYCGDFETAFQTIDEAAREFEKKQPSWLPFSQAMKTRIHLLQGDFDAAQQAAGEALFERISIPYARYNILLCLANIELAAARGDFQPALMLSERLFEETASLTRADIPEVLRWKGKAQAGPGHFEAARQTLTQACDLAERTDSNLHLWPALADLAEVESKLGEDEKAGAYRSRARTVIERIAESLQDIGLRESFLNQARVRAALDVSP